MRWWRRFEWGYVALGLVILGPLLLPGYILTFDMSWTPHLGSSTAGDTTVLYAILRGLALILPSMWAQKLLLLVIWVLAGVGMHRLVHQRFALWPAYAAGLLYVINPFTYTRLMAGQYLVLLGYALLPWLVRVLWRLLERPGWRAAAWAGGWSIAIGLVSIHAVGFMALLSLSMIGAWGWGRWRELPARLGWLAGVAGAWLAVQAFWLVPLALGRSHDARQIASFDPAQFMAFATQGDGLPVPLNTLALQGFWGDPQHRYLLPSATGLWFWLAFAAVAVLVALGIWRACRQRDRLGLALLIAGLVAWILAMGTAWPPGAGLTRWLVAHVPLYQGYREPQKWAALLALLYGYGVAGGVAALQERWHTWVSVALIVPLAWTPMLLWGAAGQLRSADYPPSWYALSQRLAAEHGSFKILALPWHEYLPLSFAGNRTVANPAPAFFGPRIISSDNPELLGVTTDSPKADNRFIEDQILPRTYFVHTIGQTLAAHDIRYILLLKQADWSDYDWLNQQTDLTLAAQTADWKLYEVTEATP